MRDFAALFQSVRCAGYSSFGVGLSDLLMNGANRSIGIGRMVVVLCSLEISFIVCKKRSCRAIGCAEIIDAAGCEIKQETRSRSGTDGR